MKQYNGYAPNEAKEIESLPAGGYVIKILSSEEETNDYGTRIVIKFDIVEGEHENYFADSWRAKNDPNAKWGGTYRISVPDESSQYFAIQKRNFENDIYSVEESNKPYKFDWNAESLKHKIVGAVFRRKEFRKDDGTTGWWTELLSFKTADKIRNGEFKIPADKPLATSNSTPTYNPYANATEQIKNDDLPF